MEVPRFLQKEHGCNENNHCTKVIKGACLVQLTKQVPPGHRSVWIASQKQAKADNEGQSWEAPNCLTEHKTFLFLHPSEQSLHKRSWGQEKYRGRDPAWGGR